MALFMFIQPPHAQRFVHNSRHELPQYALVVMLREHTRESLFHQVFLVGVKSMRKVFGKVMLTFPWIQLQFTQNNGHADSRKSQWLRTGRIPAAYMMERRR
jgi:hypothetical protein